MKSILIYLTVIFSTLLYQNNAEANYTPPKPQNPSEVDFYLLTVGVGEPIYTRFGHTILQLHDKESNRTYNFNWGIFSFEEGNFPWKFFVGSLNYHLGVSSTSQVMTTYRDYEKRKVWKDKINLTNTQKAQLVEKIYENLRPENRNYSYHHFFDNCVTRVRDLLSVITHDNIEQNFANKKSKKLYREYVKENLNSPMFVGFFLSILMNKLIDQEMSLWDEMFYPEKMRELLLDFPAFDDQGQVIPGVNLLSDSDVIIEGPSYPSSTLNLYQLINIFGLILLVFMGVSIAKKPVDHILHRVSIRLSGLCLIIWGLFSTALGIIMTLAWLFSNHKDIVHNANLWFFWPTDFIIVILGVMVLFGGQKAYSKSFAATSYTFLMAHILGFFIAIGLWGIGIIEQNISNVIFWLFPISLLLYSMNAKKIQTELREKNA